MSSHTLLLAFSSLITGLGIGDAQPGLKEIRGSVLLPSTNTPASIPTSVTAIATTNASRVLSSSATTRNLTIMTSIATLSTSTVPISITSPNPSIDGWFKPTPGTSFLWSLERAIPVNPVGRNNLALKNIQVYDIDLFDSIAAQIAEYKSQGKRVVCYFSAGSFEDWRDDAGSFDKDCYCDGGRSCKMDGWDEWWLDLNTPACVTNVQNIMKKRLELAKNKGCDAVEPDNTDSYTNTPGWKTTIADQFNYLRFLSTTAHSLGLGKALKNGPDMIQNRPAIVSLTDFVVIEECQTYNECEVYSAFVDAGKAAFQVEYERSLTCSKILPGFFALSYSSYNVDYTNVQNMCPKA